MLAHGHDQQVIRNVRCEVRIVNLMAATKLWRRKWQPTPVFLPGESHGRGALSGHGPWGRRESDTSEATKACTLTELQAVGEQGGLQNWTTYAMSRRVTQN